MKIIDTKGAILSGDDHPSLKIGDKLYVVDDRKSTWDKIQELQNASDTPDADKEKGILELALGKENSKEILENPELTVSGYTALTFYVMSAITGESYDDLVKAAKERKN